MGPRGAVIGFPCLCPCVGWWHRIALLLGWQRVLALLDLGLQPWIGVALGGVSAVREGLRPLLPRRVLKELDDERLLVVQHLVGVTPHLALQLGLLHRPLAACRRLLLRLGCHGIFRVALRPVLVPIAFFWRRKRV